MPFISKLRALAMTFSVIATAMSLSQQADCQSLPDVAVQSKLSLSRAVEIALDSRRAPTLEVLLLLKRYLRSRLET